MEQHEGEEMLTDFELFCREMDTKAEFYVMFYGWLPALKTLDTATGLRQVWPPLVKLHITSILSEEQPRLGSIQ